jgi:ribosomal protein S18 acetylase RimI-like enzyme
MISEFLTSDNRTMLLRQAEERDAGALTQAIDAVAREQLYFLRSRFQMDVDKERAFISKAAKDGNLMLAAFQSSELVGWLTLFRAHLEFMRHTGELGIGVLRAHRGVGIGSALMEYALVWAAENGFEKINLGVRASNEPALALYHSLGFVQEGRRIREVRDQYGRYDDIIEMACFVSVCEGEVTG